MGGATEAALGALHAQLDAAARETYWKALAKFMIFEIDKPSFDRVALAALGPHVAMHNAIILALLQDAQNAEAEEPLAASSALHVFGRPQMHSATNGGGGPSCASVQGQAAGGAMGGPQQQAAAPKLMLKIGMGASGMSASAQRPELRVDPQEEAQLNALHERLLNLAKQHGLQVRVQPRPRSRSLRMPLSVVPVADVLTEHARVLVATLAGGAARGGELHATCGARGDESAGRRLERCTNRRRAATRRCRGARGDHGGRPGRDPPLGSGAVDGAAVPTPQPGLHKQIRRVSQLARGAVIPLSSSRSATVR